MCVKVAGVCVDIGDITTGLVADDGPCPNVGDIKSGLMSDVCTDRWENISGLLVLTGLILLSAWSELSVVAGSVVCSSPRFSVWLAVNKNVALKSLYYIYTKGKFLKKKILKKKRLFSI